MSTYRIDGKQYAKMLFGGAAMLSEHIDELNSLNVFPVADGDTGTNMFSTVEGGLSGLGEEIPDSIGDFSRKFARATLLAARGNSGVILSQIFAGINDYLKSCDSAGPAELVDAYKNGVKTSYAAVQNPIEGTILTVFRESTEYAANNITENSTVEDFFKLHIEQARRSLEKTPELLPALAEAEVVDSGGAGYLFIAKGMYETLTGETDVAEYRPSESVKHNSIDIDRFTRDSILEFGYCTEFLLRLTSAKVDPDSFDVSVVVSELSALGGDSIVAYKTNDIVKVHVHTFTPGEILSAAQKYGEFLTIKIENMSLGHSEVEEKAKKKKKFAVVSVASGEGISSLFSDMGTDCIVSGGQTANPSIEELVSAFRKCNAENIIVLPNNKNIFLGAQQAAAVYEDARVYVIPTKNLMQGYSALSVINPGITDIDDLVTSATRAAESVIDCEVTRAVRSVSIDGRKIEEGDYMAISGGQIVSVENTPEDALIDMLKSSDTDLCEVASLFVGKGVSDDSRVALTERIESEFPDLELTVYIGDQEVYDYLLAVE